MIGRRPVTIGAVVLAVCVAWAASEKSTAQSDDKRELCERILKKVVEDEPKAAFAIIGPRCAIPHLTLLAIEKQTTQKLAQAKQTLGRIIGFELVREECVRDFASRLTYVTRYERIAVRWTFEFYRPTQTRPWVITGFSWDPDVKPLYVEVERAK